MKDTDIQWLKDINREIWRQLLYSRLQIPEEVRQLSNDEWTRFYQIATTNDGCFTELGSGIFGFGFSISLWLDPIIPFPGVDADPEHLLSITGHHLPNKYDKNKTWQVFYDIVSIENNIKKLSEFGRRPLRSQEYYDY